MNYKIVYDKPHRLRVRFGKYTFTEEQCFGLTELLFSIEGVISADVSYRNGSVLVQYTHQEVRQTLLDTLTHLLPDAIGDYTLSETQKLQMVQRRFKQKIVKHCVIYMLKKSILPGRIRHIVTAIRAIPYIKEGFVAIMHRRFGVEVLDATAIGASLCYGQYSTTSSTMFLLQLSDLMLEYTNIRSKNALAKSLAINTDRVWLIKDGQELEISIHDLLVKDVIRIRKGSMIPIDGNIVAGDGLINEATMTGESMPVHKYVKGTVFAGTLLLDGEIDIEVMRLKNDTRIAKIIDSIHTGEKEKAAIHGRAERLADGIVPISFGLALSTFFLTRNFSKALSVLMVDFSCAIKLVTPISIMSELKACASQQILVKGGKFLETLAHVDTIVFDKTGTLTHAVPKVSQIIVVSEAYTEEEVLKIAACLEEHFPHSMAAAIVAEAEERGIHHPEEHGKVDYIVAHGIASSYDGKRAIIGSWHFVFEDEGVVFPYAIESDLHEAIGGDSAIYLAVDGVLIGILCINDPPREDAKETIELLRKEGIKEMIMITGDSEGSARAISHSLGLDRYHASVLPEGKAELIEKLKEEGKTVLMVGDGINDAPALSCADVSLTLNGASDIAREVADIAILSHDLTKIVVARRIGVGLLQKLQSQYSFIMSFNTALIGMGVLGVLSASQSAWLHNTSTVALAAKATQHRPLMLEYKEVKKNETA